MNSPQLDPPGRVHIRPLLADDVVDAGLPTPPIDQDVPDWCRSVVAVTHDQLVGVGWITLDPVTDAYFTEIHVASDYRRQGIGTGLFAAVCDRADQPFPVRARVMASQPLRGHFATALGSSVLVRCPAPWIEPQNVAGARWAERQVMPAGYRIHPMEDVEIGRVIDAWATYFAWAHRPFGVVHSDRLRARWDGYAQTVDAGASMIATDADGAVVAFSLVSPDGWQDRTFIVSETVDPEQPDADSVLTATVAASVRALARDGVRLVELEGHSTDPHLSALLRSLPLAGGDPMKIVELTRRSSADVQRMRQKHDEAPMPSRQPVRQHSRSLTKRPVSLARW